MFEPAAAVTIGMEKGGDRGGGACPEGSREGGGQEIPGNPRGASPRKL